MHVPSIWWTKLNMHRNSQNQYFDTRVSISDSDEMYICRYLEVATNDAVDY